MTVPEFFGHCRAGRIRGATLPDGETMFEPMEGFKYGNGIPDWEAFQAWLKANETAILDGIIRGEHLSKKEVKNEETFKLYTLHELANRPPVHWLIQDMIPTHGFSTLYGKPNTGKSFLEIEWALSVAAGESWRDHQVDQVRVLYCCGEGIDSFNQRVQAFYVSRKSNSFELAAPNFRALDQCPKLIPGTSKKSDLEKFIRTVQEFQPGLVIIDTLGRATGGSDEGVAMMGDAISAVQEITRNWPCHVHLVHHPGKAEERGPRGGSNLLGDAEAIFHLESRGDEGLVILQCEKLRDASRLAFEPIHLKLNVISLNGLDQYGRSITSCAFSAASVELKEGSLSSKAFKTLEVMSSDKMTPAEIQEVAGISSTDWDNVLREFKKLKLVRGNRNGYYRNP